MNADTLFIADLQALLESLLRSPLALLLALALFALAFRPTHRPAAQHIYLAAEPLRERNSSGCLPLLILVGVVLTAILVLS